MDLKVVFAVVCLCVLAITSSNAGIPKCCISTRKFSRGILKKVIKVEMQRSTGVCDIDALKLYTAGMKRPFCADPTVFNDWMKYKGKMMRQVNVHKTGKI
ncbi:C-C motif chemokine 27b [Melanotaenia boesemani]|uniref:C-C motif chemokine 27b n=1 Tax=Melanotaenia boesemani TaxID=1250792 RepID=UPI001C04E4E6|nr:C-C motif chemokine 27b [Melanotaenia boesemani]